MTGGICTKGTNPGGLTYQVRTDGTVAIGWYAIVAEDFRDIVKAVEGDAGYQKARGVYGKSKKTDTEK